jgi:hypothetical protein
MEDNVTHLMDEHTHDSLDGVLLDELFSIIDHLAIGRHGGDTDLLAGKAWQPVKDAAEEAVSIEYLDTSPLNLWMDHNMVLSKGDAHGHDQVDREEGYVYYCDPAIHG